MPQSTQLGGTQRAPMRKEDRAAAMRYARVSLDDARVLEMSPLWRAGAAYHAALAAVRAVCNVAGYSDRPEAETFAEAAGLLGFDEGSLADAHEYGGVYLLDGRELPTPEEAERAVLWAERIFQLAQAHLRAEAETVGQAGEGG